MDYPQPGSGVLETRQLAERLGRHVRLAREMKGWTQTRLAELIDREQETISQYERGLRLPPLDVILAIEESLGVEPLLLIRRAVERKRKRLVRRQAIVQDEGKSA